MSIKNVVKVMNFHSLLRVDSSKKLARKYGNMEGMITDMIDNITNNRNIAIDMDCLRVKKDRPVLNIYIGSDLGFCSNLNSQVNRVLHGDEEGAKVLIGRKIRGQEAHNVVCQMTREEYDESHTEILTILEDAIKNLQYSQINLIYNHYHNAAEVEFMEKTIFPLPKRFHTLSKERYTEDFTSEGDMEPLLIKLVILYLKYQLEIAVNVSYAAENILRQNVTNDSLKKIDEREEEQHIRDLREQKDKQFAKVLDNFTKLNNY